MNEKDTSKIRFIIDPDVLFTFKQEIALAKVLKQLKKENYCKTKDLSKVINLDTTSIYKIIGGIRRWLTFEESNMLVQYKILKDKEL